MTRLFSRILVTLALVSSAIVGQASASFALSTVPMQQQSELDGQAGGSGSGKWGDAPSFTRPEVTRLSVAESPTFTQSQLESPALGAYGVTVAPVNLCRTSQAPQQGVCYNPPNRVSVTVYEKKNDGADADLSASLTRNSVIGMTIALNDAGPLLGWSYATGNPSYWKISNPGTTDAVINITFQPRDVPYIQWNSNPGSEGCSRIPVEGCPVENPDAADTLQANLLLSLDTTLNSAFNGTLFAGDDAVIGSFETSSPSSPSFTYGVASVHNEFDASQRTGTLSGVISDSMLVGYFGIDTSGMSSSEVSAAFPIVRTTDTSGALKSTVTWTRWTAGSDGTDGWLVSIDNISFSAPKYKVSQAKSPPTGSAKIKNKELKVGVKISGTAKSACKVKGTECSVRVFKIVRGKLSSLGTKNLSNSGEATVNLSKSKVTSKSIVKGTKIAVQVWAKKKSGKSTLVSSKVFTVR
jgi:hypothetical protein